MATSFPRKNSSRILFLSWHFMHNFVILGAPLTGRAIRGYAVATLEAAKLLTNAFGATTIPSVSSCNGL